MDDQNPEPWSSPLDRFFALILASYLLSRDQINDALRQYRADANDRGGAAALGQHLVSRQLLTAWQCRKLLNGQYKGFYLDNFILLEHLAEMMYSAKDTKTGVQVKLLMKPWSPDVGRIEYTVVDPDDDEPQAVHA